MTIDTVAAIAPVITAPADNSRNDTGNVAVSGTAEHYTSVELFEDIVTQGNGLVGPDGAATVTQAVG